MKCNEMLCTGENFFEYQGESHHEIGMYFSVAFPSDSALLEKGRSHLGTEGGRTLEFKWFSLVELPSVDLRPVALKEPLSEGGLPRHFVQRG